MLEEKVGSEWFVMRKMFQSVNIADSVVALPSTDVTFVEFSVTVTESSQLIQIELSAFLRSTIITSYSLSA